MNVVLHPTLTPSKFEELWCCALKGAPGHTCATCRRWTARWGTRRRRVTAVDVCERHAVRLFILQAVGVQLLITVRAPPQWVQWSRRAPPGCRGWARSIVLPQTYKYKIVDNQNTLQVGIKWPAGGSTWPQNWFWACKLIPVAHLHTQHFKQNCKLNFSNSIFRLQRCMEVWKFTTHTHTHTPCWCLNSSTE